MTLLTATFELATAAVVLVVDGAEWASVPDAITLTRQVAGLADLPVRGVQARPVVGGYFVGSDHEMPLLSTVTYRLDGLVAGVVVESASVSVSTAGVARGLWIKAPGLPDLTVCVPMRPLPEIVSETIGGVYQVAGGGGSVSQTSAQWSGVEGERTTVTVGPRSAQVRALRAVLAYRVLLLQPVGSVPDSDLDSGWYFVGSVSRVNPGQWDGFGFRDFALAVTRTTVPAGDGQGVPGASYAALAEAFPTHADASASGRTYFELSQGIFS